MISSVNLKDLPIQDLVISGLIINNSLTFLIKEGFIIFNLLFKIIILKKLLVLLI